MAASPKGCSSCSCTADGCCTGRCSAAPDMLTWGVGPRPCRRTEPPWQPNASTWLLGDMLQHVRVLPPVATCTKPPALLRHIATACSAMLVTKSSRAQCHPLFQSIISTVPCSVHCSRVTQRPSALNFHLARLLHQAGLSVCQDEGSSGTSCQQGGAAEGVPAQLGRACLEGDAVQHARRLPQIVHLHPCLLSHGPCRPLDSSKGVFSHRHAAAGWRAATSAWQSCEGAAPLTSRDTQAGRGSVTLMKGSGTGCPARLPQPLVANKDPAAARAASPWLCAMTVWVTLPPPSASTSATCSAGMTSEVKLYHVRSASSLCVIQLRRPACNAASAACCCTATPGITGHCSIPCSSQTLRCTRLLRRMLWPDGSGCSSCCHTMVILGVAQQSYISPALCKAPLPAVHAGQCCRWHLAVSTLAQPARTQGLQAACLGPAQCLDVRWGPCCLACVLTCSCVVAGRATDTIVPLPQAAYSMGPADACVQATNSWSCSQTGGVWKA